MKKVISSLLLIVFILPLFSFVQTAYADIGMVYWDPYYAWCIRKEGMIIRGEGYGYEDTFIPYGARFYVWHGNNMEVAYSPYDDYFVEYGERSFSFSHSIRGDNFRPINKNPDPELLAYEDIRLYACYDTNIYDGPSADYKKTGTLLQGNEVYSDYNDGMWAHLTGGEYEGWIYFNQTCINDDLPQVIIINGNELKIENAAETHLYDSPNGDQGETIKAGSTFTYLGSCSSSFARKYFYVQNGDKKGWIRNDEGERLIFDTMGARLIAYDGVVLYKNLSDETVSTVVQENEEAEVLNTVFDSEGKERYYCRYEGQEGWTAPSASCFVDLSIIRGYEKAYLDEETSLFNRIDGSPTDTVVGKNEEFLVVSSIQNGDSAWHYIRNEEKEGWINADLHKEADHNAEYYAAENKSKRSVPDVMYYYAAGTLIISISTFVLIRYLNLRKK